MVLFWFWFHDTLTQCSSTYREKNYTSLGIRNVKDACTIVSMICGLKKIENRELTKCFCCVGRGYQTLSAASFLVSDLCSTFFVLIFFISTTKSLFLDREQRLVPSTLAARLGLNCALNTATAKLTPPKKRRVYSIAAFSVIDGEFLK